MSNQRKGLRSAPARPASTGARKKRLADRRAIWCGAWLRLLLIVSVVGLPVLAAGLAGPTIRGGSSWKGMRLGDQDAKGGNGSGGSGNAESGLAGGGRADFGQVGVKLFNPITRGRIQADFHLEGVAILGDGPALEKILKNKYHFIREQATVAIRNSSTAELVDPKQKMLERRVLIRINRSLARPLLKSVDLAKFSLSESTPELDLMGDGSDEP